ncbi:hypothetical protein D9M73_87500 [compost metagenome]
MRGDDNGPSDTGARNHRDQRGLRRSVEMRGRFVQQQQRRVLQKRPRQGDAATLATRQTATAMIEPLLKPADAPCQGILQPNRRRDRRDLGGCCIGAAKPDIVRNRAREQHRSLPCPSGERGDAANLLKRRAIDPDLALVGRNEPQQQVQHTAFAAARGPDQRDDLARPNLDRHIADRIAVLPGVADGDVVEHDRRGCHHRKTFPDRRHRRRIERGQPRTGGLCRLSIMIGCGEAAHRRIEFGGERQHEEGAHQIELFGSVEGQLPEQRKPGIDRDQRHRQRREKLQRRRRQESDAQHPHRPRGDLARGLAQALGFARLPLEGEDHRQTADAIGEQAR